MSDDMFDLGDPADDPDTSSPTADSDENDTNATTADNASTDSSAGNDTNATSRTDTDHGSPASEPADPKRTPAFDVEYLEHQHTIAAQDATWRDLTDLLEDARAHSKLDGYANVTRFEAYEALCQHVLTEVDPQDIAALIEETRHENLS